MLSSLATKVSKIFSNISKSASPDHNPGSTFEDVARRLLIRHDILVRKLWLWYGDYIYGYEFRSAEKMEMDILGSYIEDLTNKLNRIPDGELVIIKSSIENHPMTLAGRICLGNENKNTLKQKFTRLQGNIQNIGRALEEVIKETGTKLAGILVANGEKATFRNHLGELLQDDEFRSYVDKFFAAFYCFGFPGPSEQFWISEEKLRRPIRSDISEND